MEEIFETEATPTPDGKETGNGKERRNCEALNANGEPCASWAMSGGNFCWSHEPTNAAGRHAARVLGGASNRAKHSPRVNLGQIPKEIRTIEDLFLLLDYCKDEMLMLSNGLNRNRGIVQLATTYASVIRDSGMEDHLSDLQDEVLGLLEKAKATRKR